ncbi:MAG: WW domain containing E3 ubiquitin protein ligase 1, partial [Marteilia pararefringens]
FVDIVDAMTMNEGHQWNRTGNKPSESFKASLAAIKAMIELNHTNIRFKFIIKKDDLFASKCDAIIELSYSAFHQQLMITFRHAAGIDYGALLNELVLDLSVELFKPENGVFCKISDKSDYLMLNPVNFKPSYLKALGRLIALCIFQQKNMAHGPSLIFFKNLARRHIVLSDTREVDEEFYQNNLYLLENDIDEMDLGLSFTAEMPLPDGASRTIELVPGGENITVTDENKAKYVNLLVSWNYKGIYQRHFDVIINEVTSIIPLEILTSLKSAELQFVICGLSEIDIDDWEKNTVYQDYDEKSVTIQHFWQCLRSLPSADVAKIKYFATGTTSVPPGGFADLKSMNKPMKFNIKRIPIITNLQQAPLPLSHACFNKLELPDYKNYDVLVEKLMFAAKETNSFELK